MNCYVVPLNTACVKFFPICEPLFLLLENMRLLTEYLIKVLDEKNETLIRQLTIKKKASISRRKVQGAGLIE